MPSSAEFLRRVVREFDREKAKLDRQIARSVAKRDKAIRKAHTDGMSQREIAEITGLSFQRVSQIIRGTRI